MMWPRLQLIKCHLISSSIDISLLGIAATTNLARPCMALFLHYKFSTAASRIAAESLIAAS